MRNVFITSLSMVGWIFITLFSSGCGLFYKNPPEHKLWAKLGVDSYHFETCGPTALHKVHKNFGKEIDKVMISVELQQQRAVNIYPLLGLIDEHFRGITGVGEMKSYCRRNGFNVDTVDYEDLKEGDIAVVLLKGYDDLYEWHWMVWPDQKDKIPTYFDEHTKIIRTYLITG